MHAFTIDLEEWFCTHNFASALKPDDWPRLQSRISFQTDYLLALLQRHNVRATFFILGWVADRFPEVIKDIASQGHDIGSHGYSHQLTWNHSPRSFGEDLQQSTASIERIIGYRPTIFRAPAFSIVKRTLWAADELVKAGYTTDSSVYPIGLHPEYGISGAPLLPFQMKNGLTEIPLSCIHLWGRRIPMSGGAYFRLLPYTAYKKMVKQLEAEGRKLNFYIHPWETDPNIPGLPRLSFQRHWRHYTGLSTVSGKLNKLLLDFPFGTLSQTFNLSNPNALAS